MGVGVSIFIITLGLILKFAIAEDALTDPVDIHVIGVILIIVGAASFLLQLLVLNRMQRSGGPGRLTRRQDDQGTPYDPYDPENRPPA